VPGKPFTFPDFWFFPVNRIALSTRLASPIPALAANKYLATLVKP
jgi:hypothetical protein